MADEVSAINHRNVHRYERPERTRVVPVVEVTAMPLHFFRRPERFLSSVQQASDGTVTEVVRGQIRQQRHSDIGRARSCCNGPRRMLLEIVRWEPIFLLGDERFEIPPGPAADLPQESAL